MRNYLFQSYSGATYEVNAYCLKDAASKLSQSIEGITVSVKGSTLHETYADTGLTLPLVRVKCLEKRLTSSIRKRSEREILSGCLPCRIESAYAEDDAEGEPVKPTAFKAYCGDDAGQYLVLLDTSRQFPVFGVLSVHDGAIDSIGEFPSASEALDHLNQSGDFGWEGQTCQLWQDTGYLSVEGHSIPESELTHADKNPTWEGA